MVSSPVQLAADLRDAGRLADTWLESFRQVRREDFIPRRIWFRTDAGYQPLTRDDDPGRWLRMVYSDTALVTQVEDGDGANVALVPTSSSSMPRVVAEMLDALRAEEGHRVLEVGTGTGFNAALLAHRLGDRNVITIETDPELADAARASLTRAGRSPLVVTGDGAMGWAEGAPYDRVIVTYALHHIPYSLIQQTAPGGQLLLPWGTGLYNGVLVRLTVSPDGDGSAGGPVLGDCAFMWDRGQAPQRDVMATVSHDVDASTVRTGLDPRLVLGDDDAAFATGVIVPNCRYAVGHGEAGEWTLWLADADSGAWASVDFVPDADSFDVQQYGPRMLWDEVAAAYEWWRDAGSPQRTRFGITVRPDGHHVWLDDPNNPVPGPGLHG
jgi:protein-L-isoaspartate(D-aspartate) O-methyltransferase